MLKKEKSSRIRLLKKAMLPVWYADQIFQRDAGQAVPAQAARHSRSLENGAPGDQAADGAAQKGAENDPGGKDEDPQVILPDAATLR